MGCRPPLNMDFQKRQWELPLSQMVLAIEKNDKKAIKDSLRKSSFLNT